MSALVEGYQPGTPAPPGHIYTAQPTGWNARWLARKAAAAAGTGVANVACIGDSVTAGQNPTAVDGLLYGYVGRLQALLVAAGLPLAQQFIPCLPYVSTVAAASKPYAWVGSGAGGAGTNSGLMVAQTFYNGGGATWEEQITVPAGVTAGIDVLWVNGNASSSFTWKWDINGAGGATITAPSVTQYTGATVNRTHIACVAGDVIRIGCCSAANVMFFMGCVFYYATAGLGMAWSGYPGTSAVNTAEGAGALAGSQAGVNLASYVSDKITLWGGLASSANLTGGGFPFQPDLAIIAHGINDDINRSHPLAFERTIARTIQALRFGQGGVPSTSIIVMATGTSALYSFESAAQSRSWRYKRILSDVARAYGCAFVDVDTYFGQNQIANGFMAAANIHPTANGAGTGGGDGHLAMAQLLAGIL